MFLRAPSLVILVLKLFNFYNVKYFLTSFHNNVYIKYNVNYLCRITFKLNNIRYSQNIIICYIHIK